MSKNFTLLPIEARLRISLSRYNAHPDKFKYEVCKETGSGTLVFKHYTIYERLGRKTGFFELTKLFFTNRSLYLYELFMNRHHKVLVSFFKNGKVCPNCNEIIHKNSLYCTHCYTQLL